MALSQVSEIRELSVRYSSLKKKILILGFVKRCAWNFSPPLAIKLLHCSLVRPWLGYASAIWSPNQAKHIRLIERIQHSSLRYVTFKSGHGMAFADHNYNQIMSQLSLEPLEPPRTLADLLFLFKPVNGIITTCWPRLLQLIHFYAPMRPFRSSATFSHASLYIWSFLIFDPINRIHVLLRIRLPLFCIFSYATLIPLEILLSMICKSLGPSSFACGSGNLHSLQYLRTLTRLVSVYSIDI